MRRKRIDKRYIYMRDHQSCHHCGKKLQLGKVSLDHYYPKSHGGPDEVFNLVASCKSCNFYKRSSVPSDWQALCIRYFVQGVEDNKILVTIPRVKQRELLGLVIGVRAMHVEPNYTVFISDDHEFYVYQNKVFKINLKGKSNR